MSIKNTLKSYVKPLALSTALLFGANNISAQEVDSLTQDSTKTQPKLQDIQDFNHVYSADSLFSVDNLRLQFGKDLVLTPTSKINLDDYFSARKNGLSYQFKKGKITLERAIKELDGKNNLTSKEKQFRDYAQSMLDNLNANDDNGKSLEVLNNTLGEKDNIIDVAGEGLFNNQYGWMIEPGPRLLEPLSKATAKIVPGAADTSFNEQSVSVMYNLILEGGITNLNTINTSKDSVVAQKDSLESKTQSGIGLTQIKTPLINVPKIPEVDPSNLYSHTVDPTEIKGLTGTQLFDADSTKGENIFKRFYGGIKGLFDSDSTQTDSLYSDQIQTIFGAYGGSKLLGMELGLKDKNYGIAVGIGKGLKENILEVTTEKSPITGRYGQGTKEISSFSLNIALEKYFGNKFLGVGTGFTGETTKSIENIMKDDEVIETNSNSVGNPKMPMSIYGGMKNNNFGAKVGYDTDKGFLVGLRTYFNLNRPNRN